MSDTLKISPEAAEFVDAVRARLSDLSEEEREELAGGLAADIDELVGERGSGALPDPAEYAAELRVAAGFDAETAPPRRRRDPSAAAVALLDASGLAARGVLNSLPGDAAGVVTAMRPAWWVLRAWVAVQVAIVVVGGQGLMPAPVLLGLPILLAAVVLSVQIGRGRLWPWLSRGPGRLVLLALNAVAAVALPVLVARLETGFHREYFEPYVASEGLVHDGEPVSNVFPYDAQGRPLTGVQLFDQDGSPLTSSPSFTEELDGAVLYGWRAGATEQFHVFPLPVGPGDPDFLGKRDPQAWSSTNPPRLPQPPLLQVAPVSLPTATPSTTPTPTPAPAPTSTPTLTPGTPRSPAP